MISKGHKEFHTAGIHLAQMLYIWPYFAFFSWPLLVVPVINVLAPKKLNLPKYLNYGLLKKQKTGPRILAALMVVPAMLAIVHFNTIVHPFTLADNRHYVFYVFRLLLGIHPAVKYAVVPVYFLCAWAVISVLGFTSVKRPQLLQIPSTPKPATPPAKSTAVKEQPAKASPRSNAKAANKKGQQQAQQKPAPLSPEVYARVQEHLIERQKNQQDAPRVSFVLVWLAATALSLVTAPLVEPRYLIIPWVMWRLHLPPAPTLAAYKTNSPKTEDAKTRAEFAVNAPKFLETVWFVIINAVTGYVFLYKGFEWPQEPGKIQRFMW